MQDHPPSPNTPNASAPDAAPPPVPVVLTAKEVGKMGADWFITLHSTHLSIASPTWNHPPVGLRRDEIIKDSMFMEGLNVFGIQKPRKLQLKLAPADTRAVSEWIGKPLLASFYLRRRYGWVLPVALIWILFSLPISGDPPVPFDPVGLGLGCALAVCWLFAKFRPHPVLFLIDSIWFLFLGGTVVVDVVRDGRHKAWLVFTALTVWMAYSGARHFIRFRSTRIAPEVSKPGRS